MRTGLLVLICLAASSAGAQSMAQPCTNGGSCSVQTLNVGGDPVNPRQSQRRIGWSSQGNTGSSGVSWYGMLAQGTTGTLSVNLTSNRYYQTFTSAAAVTGTCSGLCASNEAGVRIQWLPAVRVLTQTASAITLRRTWYGLTSAALTAVTHATGPTASAIHFAALGYDTSISANWRCCSGDGTNYSCVDIPNATVNVSEEQDVTVDWSVSGQVTCSVQKRFPSGVKMSVTKSTNISVNTGGLLLQASTTTLENVAKTCDISRVEVESN